MGMGRGGKRCVCVGRGGGLSDFFLLVIVLKF